LKKPAHAPAFFGVWFSVTIGLWSHPVRADRPIAVLTGRGTVQTRKQVKPGQ
jgi:hypothetical protein